MTAERVVVSALFLVILAVLVAGVVIGGGLHVALSDLVVLRA